MMDAKIKIVIADSNKPFAEGLSQILNTAKIEVTDIVYNASALSELTYASYFHIILIDAELPGINGFTIITSIKRRCPKVKIIMLATHNEEHFISKAHYHGADAYLLKNMDKEELLNVISLVLQENTYFRYHNKAKYIIPTDKSILESYCLTKRETQLLEYIKARKSNQEIAKQLSLSLYTIKAHRKNILQKLSLSNISELHNFLIEHNI